MTKWAGGGASLVVPAGTGERAVALLSCDRDPAGALALGPCRLSTEWGTLAPGQLPSRFVVKVEHGTPSGGRVRRELAVGQSCPVYPLDLSAALVYRASPRSDVDLGALAVDTGATYSARATCEPAIDAPAEWLASTPLVPGIAAGGITLVAVPPHARYWRPLLSSSWLSGLAGWSTYPSAARDREWTWTEFLAASRGEWLAMPPAAAGCGEIILGGGLLRAPAGVSLPDIGSILWRCSR